jgi:hypothetical protein
MIGRPKQLGVAVDREKMRQTIRKVLEDRGGNSLGERTEIYSAARTSVRKATNDEPAIMAELDQTIDEIEASYKTKPKIGSSRRGVGLSLLAAGVVVGGAAAAGIMVAGFHFRPPSPIAAKLKRQYHATAPLVPAAVDYLHKVVDAVAAMQKNDPTALEAEAAKRFVSVASLDPALWKQFPKSMPPGSRVVVKADKNDYKVLFNWTLCGAAQITVPAMVEPVRTRAKTLGCPYFGLWTSGAAKW